MEVQTNIPSFWEAFRQITGQFALATAVVFLVAFAIGFLILAVKRGPLAAGDAIYRMLRNTVLDLAAISPRRVWALARLAIKESIRRRVVVVLVIFGLIITFAGWFLDSQNFNPARLYLSFGLSATSYLMLLLALFLSTFSLPADIKNRTIYTIVTKPVRAGEIVLGRIVGFMCVGTAMLAVMGVADYLFVIRALDHTHEVNPADVIAAQEGKKLPRSEQSQKHVHELLLDADGNGRTNFIRGHRHEVTAHTVNGETEYTVGPPLDMLVARVPIYGKLQFFSRDGLPAERGISVGQEWDYRRYIEGGSLMSGIWTFQNLTKERFPDGLPLELTIRVFRTQMGNIVDGIVGGLRVRNPDTKQLSETITFQAKEFVTDEQRIPRQLRDKNGQTVDLFEEFVTADGRIEIQLQCLEVAHYFGVAEADLYIRAPAASFRWNFIKAHLSIWLQMLLVTALGVMFSTLVSGPVAMLATVGCIILGFFTSDVFALAKSVIDPENVKKSERVWGGGPIEALIRTVTYQNLTTPMENTPANRAVQFIDKEIMKVMRAAAHLVPDFKELSDVEYVPYGFSIPGELLGAHLVYAFYYTLLMFLLGYLFLRTRELAA